MTAAELRACGRRLVEELFNQGDLSVADHIFALGYTEHSVAEQVVVAGVDGVKRFVTEVRRAFPDIRCRIDDQIVEGDKLVQLMRASGTHQGREFLGVPAAGNPIAIDLVGLFHMGADAKILEGWVYVDQFLLRRQLGARMPP